MCALPVPSGHQVEISNPHPLPRNMNLPYNETKVGDLFSFDQHLHGKYPAEVRVFPKHGKIFHWASQIPNELYIYSFKTGTRERVTNWDLIKNISDPKDLLLIDSGKNFDSESYIPTSDLKGYIFKSGKILDWVQVSDGINIHMYILTCEYGSWSLYLNGDPRPKLTVRDAFTNDRNAYIDVNKRLIIMSASRFVEKKKKTYFNIYSLTDGTLISGNEDQVFLWGTSGSYWTYTLTSEGGEGDLYRQKGEIMRFALEEGALTVKDHFEVVGFNHRADLSRSWTTPDFSIYTDMAILSFAHIPNKVIILRADSYEIFTSYTHITTSVSSKYTIISYGNTINIIDNKSGAESSKDLNLLFMDRPPLPQAIMAFTDDVYIYRLILVRNVDDFDYTLQRVKLPLEESATN